MIVDVSAKNFILQSIDTESLKLGEADFIILLIKADWCVHCINYMRQFEEYSTQFSKAHFLVLESTTPENRELLDQWAGLAYPVVPTFAGAMEEREPGKPWVYNTANTLRFPTVVIYSGSGVPVKVVKNRFDLESEIAGLQL